jgi:transcriptional regulator with XRE-family HTH domain
MDHHMPINHVKVRQLRLDRSWSQEHLAEASGLSLRTIQRVESEGTASLETRMAIASALEVPAVSLSRPTDNVAPPNYAALLRTFPGKPVGIVFGVSYALFGILNGWMGVSGMAPPHGLFGTWLGLTCAMAGFVANHFNRSPKTA